jgi:ubiquinone/menaquinone biosynthesis C-methylase UbiE
MNYEFLRKKAIGFSLVLILLVYPLAGCNTDQKQHSSVTQQRFSDIDRWIKIFEDPERDEWQKPGEIVKTMNLRKGDVVADIGAGTGYFTRLFAIAVAPEGKALGLDIESSMVTYMEEDAKKLNLRNYEAKLVGTDDPDLEPNSVDVIFLCNTYHHIKNRVNYFKRVSKSLKTNGGLVVVDFYNKKMPVGPPPDHTLPEKTVLEELKEAGYRLTKNHDILSYQYFLEFELSLLQ